ncbi:RHS repeat-associated core domain-containing protein [Pseudomonas sp.]|uniref:RHS repeat-associated core domain-containing protein n=1 Tax=Pseudomonas sp. TaxID=306 RepID=UPI002E30AFA7|nr:RHS repeat-associated core domain-containing protein [Pseudomonas sp.]HEX4551415.1 RHS repeat-associated core domain-containing protein [Pseudomonas sp.]
MESSPSGSVHSNAFNFDEFVTGGVDPRTGLYTCSLSLGTVRSAGLNGPSFNLALGFNPLQRQDSGYGLGWTLASTRYDVRNRVLTLASGERYKAVETTTGLEFRELKLESVKVLKKGGGHYEVRFKDGRREELRVHKNSGMAVPIRIMAANGTELTLTYDPKRPDPLLVEVRDAQRSLLKILRPNTRRITLSQNPDTPSRADVALTLRPDGRVGAIGLPVGKGWNLDYEIIDDIGYLSRVVTPLGAVETIRYKQEGHFLPSGGAVATLPHVLSHVIHPGHGQPKIEKTYTFSDWNFLGHGLTVESTDGGDPLYQAPWSYQYSSEERLLVNAKVHTHTKRIYNKFHLMESQVTTCAEAVTSLETEFHCVQGKSFIEQPPQFRLPRVQTLSFRNRLTQAVRKEVTVTECDAAGNLLKHIGPDGVMTLVEFYPVTESADCPADPLGFVRFEKQRTVVAAAGGGSSTVTRFRYATHPVLQGASVPNVVAIEESLFELAQGSETLRSKTRYSYFDTPQEPLTHGALQEQSLTLSGNLTRTAMDYRLEGTDLQVHRTVHGFDGTLASTQEVLSTLNGLKLSETSEEGLRVDYEYDLIGRCLRKTIAAGTTHAAITRWVYQSAANQDPATMTVTDPAGGEQKVSYDGLGRVIAIQERDCDHPQEESRQLMRTVYGAVHDATGRLVEQTCTDWWDDVARPARIRFVYDGWGQVKETHHADGRKEYRERDPVLRKETSWQEGMGKTVTLINQFGKPHSIEVQGLDGGSLGTTVFEYDGFGRSISQTDPDGNRTRFHYDVFDRLVRTELPDGNTVKTAYALHSSESLPISVEVAGRELGRQTFDGLGRLTANTVGGRTSTMGYDSGSSQIKWHMSPGAQKIEYARSSHLSGRLTERKAGGLLATFTYDPVHAKPQACIEQGRESHYTYYPSGRLKSETTKLGNLTQTASHTYSLGGRPLTYIDGLGVAHTAEYDVHGRKSAFTQGDLRAEYTYDKKGLLERIEARDKATRRLMVTRIAYDDIGRETSRRFEVEGLVTQVLTSGYSRSGKLTQKCLKRDAQVLRDERYSYDSRGRLTHYQCEGSQRPLDPYGKEIIEQTFTFDAFDNLLALQTRFPQGVNLTTFTYSEVDPTQLIGVRHSHADYPSEVTLQYDANGRMVKDDQGRSLTYDALGRMTQVRNAQGEAIRDYHYDAFDRLAELSQPDSANTQRYYLGDHVINEVRGSDSRSVLRHEGLLLGQHQSGLDAGIQLFGTDQQHSVLTQLQDQQFVDTAYSPYGHRAVEGGFFGLAGFNGEQLDPVTGLYLLGNGYRAYSPTLMRFTSPDSLSPFDAGGLNPYAYCLGDPVNRVDPTGHFSWQSILGIALGAIGIAVSIVTLGVGTLAFVGLGLGLASGLAGIAAELTPETEAGSILGWVSLGLGIASLGTGLAAAAKGAIHVGRKLESAFRQGLSSKGTGKAAMNFAKKGKGAAKGAKGQSEPPAPPERWTLTEDFAAHDYLANGKPGNVPRAKYAEFRNDIAVNNKSPYEASRSYPGSKFDPYPNYAPAKAYTGYEHAHTRISQGDRVFFLTNNDTRHVIIKQVGSHDPSW